MRSPALSVLLLLAIPLSGSPARPQNLPGHHQVASRSVPFDPPVHFPPKSAAPAFLEDEAAELARLSAGIPEQIQNVNHKLLPKDLGNQLKRIEKLAKHLRSELEP